MQLRSARLCLDCDEVHDAQRCPHCASETFAFITRWVPVPPDRPDRPDRLERAARPDRSGRLERVNRPDRPKTRARSLEATSAETLGAYREMLQPEPKGDGKWRTIRRGAVGLALFGLAGWLWRNNARPGEDSDHTTTGDETSKQERT